MKTYILDIIPKIQRYSKKLDDLSLLQNHHWVILDEANYSKNVYIFRDKNELLISQNGKVVKAKWEYLGNNSLLIEHGNECYMFRHGFFDENVLALKVDSKEEYALLINENSYHKELTSHVAVEKFLLEKYSVVPENDSSTLSDNNYKSPALFVLIVFSILLLIYTIASYS